MNSRQIGILSAIALLALPLVGRASVPLVTKTFASSSLAGSSAPFSPGSSKICSVLFTSSGDATVTIRGQPIRGMASIQPIQASARTEPSQIRVLTLFGQATSRIFPESSCFRGLATQALFRDRLPALAKRSPRSWEPRHRRTRHSQ
jgi:hypothetical protein